MREFEKSRSCLKQYFREVYNIPWLTIYVGKEQERFDILDFDQYWNLELYLEERNITDYLQAYEEYYASN